MNLSEPRSVVWFGVANATHVCRWGDKGSACCQWGKGLPAISLVTVPFLIWVSRHNGIVLAAEQLA